VNLPKMLCKRSLSKLFAENARVTFGNRRTLFSLPDIFSLSPFPSSGEPSKQKTYHERKILAYTPKQLYRVVADVGSYPLFVPFCIGSRILHSNVDSTASLTTMEAELTVGFLAFEERYVSKVTCIPFKSVEAIASTSTPLFETLSTIWRFQQAPRHGSQLSSVAAKSHLTDEQRTELASADERPTLVTLDLTYAFANPLHASVSNTFFGQVSKQMVRAFEERCLAVYGAQ